MNFKRLRKAGLMPTEAPQAAMEFPQGERELANGWTPPPASAPTDHAFAVLRSKHGWLPVYTRYRQSVAYTKVRRVYGDATAFMAELGKVTAREPRRNESGSLTTVEVKGNHVVAVRRWLASLGF